MKYIISIIILFFFSCSTERLEDTFVKIRLKSLNDERIQLFYTSSEKESFNNELRILKKISGSNEFQNINFEIPKTTKPIKFRLDLGENQLETPIFIQNIEIENGKTSIEVDNETLRRFFKPNIYLKTYDFKKFERKKINGKYDPFLISTPLLDKKIHLEFR